MGRPQHWGGTPDPEELDSRPVEMPAGACRPKPINQIIAEMVRNEVMATSDARPESWTEADDFEEENPELLDFSPYELTDVHTEAPEDILQELAQSDLVDPEPDTEALNQPDGESDSPEG